MTSLPIAKDVRGTELTSREKDFSICHEPNEMNHTIRVLERLAYTLGVPVDVFFAEPARSISDEASPEEIAELAQAFRAIRDPVMRRYCLDVVKAAGADVPVPPPV